MTNTSPKSSRLLPAIVTGLLVGIFSLAYQPGIAAAQPAEDPPADESADPNDDTTPDSADGVDESDPTTTEPTPEPDPPEAKPANVDELRRRYLELRDKLFRSRARAATVSSALYSTRIQISLDYKSARQYTVTRATVRLDGANVFDDSEGKIGEDKALRFEGYVAPGRHRLSIRIEAIAKDDDRFTTATESTFVVVAPKDRDLIVNARAEDDGNIAYNWQRKTSGSYRLHLDVDVKTKKSDRKSGKKSRKKSAARTVSKPATRRHAKR